MGLFWTLKRLTRASRPRRQASLQPPGRPMPREMRFPVAQPSQIPRRETILRGRCWVIDGDTIVIDKVHIRLAGIDAPELDHPWGQQAKWAMVKLCKGQTVTAHIRPEISYDRVVADCFLADGRDLAAELVKAGLALDWPKFSDGKYRSLEPADARKKLWRASIRQSGVRWPEDAEGMAPVATQAPSLPPPRSYWPIPEPALEDRDREWPKYWFGWLIVPAVVVVLVGCNFVGSDPGSSTPASTTPPRTGQSVPAFAGFVVTAEVLNVRNEPSARSSVIGQIGKGSRVFPNEASGNWFGIEMSDGATGWVHSDFLSSATE